MSPHASNLHGGDSKCHCLTICLSISTFKSSTAALVDRWMGKYKLYRDIGRLPQSIVGVGSRALGPDGVRQYEKNLRQASLKHLQNLDLKPAEQAWTSHLSSQDAATAIDSVVARGHHRGFHLPGTLWLPPPSKSQVSSLKSRVPLFLANQMSRRRRLKSTRRHCCRQGQCSHYQFSHLLCLQHPTRLCRSGTRHHH